MPPEVWVLLAVLVAALLVLGFGAHRLRTLTSRVGTFHCGVRRPTRKGGVAVSYGVAEFRSERVDWWRVWSLFPRPKYRWRRDALHVVGHERLSRRGIGELVLVRCEYEGRPIELVMTPSASAGLTSWLEASPPSHFGVIV